MAELKQVSGNQVLDYMARDYHSFLSAMRALIPEKLPEWTDFDNEADHGKALIELFCHMADIMSYYQDRIANESFLTTARERRSIIQHLRLIGYSLATAVPSSTNLSVTVPVASSGQINIKRGHAFATKSSDDSPSVRFEFNGADKSVDLGSFIVDPGGLTKHFILPVEEGRLIKDDIIGISDGSPNQHFTLGFSPLILRSIGSSEAVNLDISLRSELGSDINSWTLQESLAFSREGQLDYAIEIDENDKAVVVLGDNILGAIPPAGTVIKATYRVGGGVQGNAVAVAINTIVDAPALTLLAASVTNKSPATGGAEHESIEHAVQHAPNVFRAFKRAVTADDYKALALNFQGVGKVRAKATHWNRVTLYVAPDGGGRVSDILKANLLAYFEDKRPLSTLIEIADVDYVRTYVQATVELESYYSRVEMKDKIEKAVASLLEFDAVDFGDTTYLSKFYEAIEAIEGVAFVNITQFHSEKDPLPAIQPEGRITLETNEIPRLPGTAVDDPASDADYIAGIHLLSIEGGY